MSFDSFSDFLAMGGHGLYVWLSYGIGLVIIVLNLVLPMRTRKRIMAEQTRRLIRESKR